MRSTLQLSAVLVVLCSLAISGCSAVLAESRSGVDAPGEPAETSVVALAAPASASGSGNADIEGTRPDGADRASGAISGVAYGWYGYVITPPAGQPFEYYLNLSPKESGNAGLVTAGDEIGTRLAELRDSGRLAHFWGLLSCDVPDFSGCQVEVTRVRPEGPGEIGSPDPVEGWRGTLQSLPAGAQYDDVFVLSDPLFPVRYGIGTQDATLVARLETLRDTGNEFLVFGDLTCGEMDVNGCRIQVSRIEGDNVVAPEVPEGVAAEGVNDWVGQIKSTPDGAQFDDYFEKMSFDGGVYGIDAQDETLRQRIVSLRDSGAQVHVWGKLVSDVPDYGTTQIVVTRLEVDEQPEAPEVVAEQVDDWVGVVVSAPEMAQFDDYFQGMDQNGTRAGIWADGELGSRIEALRDTGTVVHVWGTIRYNVPDAYNAQITVTRMEVGE